MTSPAERKAQQRARARKNGLCSSCCYRKARKGKAYCLPCTIASNERAARNYRTKTAPGISTPKPRTKGGTPR